MSEDRALYGVHPLPCLRDEHGEIKRQTVKQLFAKINEELDELKEIVLVHNCMAGRAEFAFCGDLSAKVAEEASDTITAITTLCEALGIDADMRDEAQRRVNEKNRERVRL